jgi:hypothetical protein
MSLDNTSTAQEAVLSSPEYRTMAAQLAMLTEKLSQVDSMFSQQHEAHQSRFAQQERVISELRDEISSTQEPDDNIPAQHAVNPTPTLLELPAEYGYQYPPEITSLFSEPFLDYKRLSTAERKKLMDDFEVPECAGLTPCVLPPTWEEFIRNKTMPVKTFYDEHLMQAQYRHLDAIRFASFFVAHVLEGLPEERTGTPMEDDDDTSVDLRSLGRGLLILLRDAQTGQALAGKDELAKHTGTAKALQKLKGPTFFSDGDMQTIETSNKQVAQMRSLLPKKSSFSSNSFARPQGGRGKSLRRGHGGRSRSGYTPPSTRAPEQSAALPPAKTTSSKSSSSKPSRK